MRIGFVCASVLVAVGLFAIPADAGSKAGRVKFVRAADEICQKKINDAERKVARGVRSLNRHHLRAAGRDFEGAYQELRQGYKRIARLHRPGKDHRKIATWLHRERGATATGVDAAVALQHRELQAAARLTQKSALLERQAYGAVRKLDFKHCRPL
jgi:hypothetical protein